MSFDLRLGRWQDVLAVEEVDAVIIDHPYGKRTHENSETERADGADTTGFQPQYEYWTPDHVMEFARSWSPRTRGWICALSSHDLIPAWEAAADEVGRYCFAPVPCVINGMSVRNLGDGPSSEAVYLVVSRPRRKEFVGSGARPGKYVVPRGQESGGGRGKPMWLMSGIVRDYSKPGEIVADPMAGWGTTLAAAIGLGRRAIGSEVDADAHKEALRRLARPLQVDLFATTGAA